MARITAESVTGLAFHHDQHADAVETQPEAGPCFARFRRPSGQPGHVFIALNDARGLTRVALVYDGQDHRGDTVAIVHGLDQYDVLAAIVGAL